MRLVLANTCLHVDAHVSIADVEGVTLMKFAEVLNSSRDKLPMIKSEKLAQDLEDLFKTLECNIMLHSSVTSRKRNVRSRNEQLVSLVCMKNLASVC